jgi:hypothetical protein
LNIFFIFLKIKRAKEEKSLTCSVSDHWLIAGMRYEVILPFGSMENYPQTQISHCPISTWIKVYTNKNKLQDHPLIQARCDSQTE